MKIAIIGHGNVGGALARSWAAKGHEVLIGTRDSASEKVQKLAALDNIRAHSIEAAAEQAEVILIATPAHIASELAVQLSGAKDKVIIDATNAVMKQPAPHPTLLHAFKAAGFQKVAKCFNTTGFENMANPQYGETAADMFVAGDNAEAKAVAQKLSDAAGFGRCYDFGGDGQVELLEKLALSWINLAIFQKHGRNMAFKVLWR